MSYKMFSTFHANIYPVQILKKNIDIASCIRQICCSNVLQKFRATIPSDNKVDNDINQLPEYSEEIMARVAEQYPQAHGSLKNIMATVAKELRNPKSFDVTYAPVKKSKHLTGWSCSCHLDWPSVASFSAIGKTKQEASRTVSLKVLQWLLMQGKIKGNKPVLISKSSAAALKNVDIHITLDPTSRNDLRKLLEEYNKDILSLVNEAQSTTESTYLPLPHRDDIISISETSRLRSVHTRNKMLHRRALQRLDDHIVQTQLPIHKFRSEHIVGLLVKVTNSIKDEIMDSIERNQVLVIKGEPGCGKSTQVPQFILDKSAIMGSACNTNIIVTQPRRISAITLAERVASERCEEVGDCVGYQVRFKSRLPRPAGGSIRFCSSGILLRILQSNPTLEGVSHVILDEAHERDVNTDMLMLLLKRIIGEKKDLKLIIMSATINPELFQRYYASAASLFIPGFTHPVQSFYLEDITQVPLRQTRLSEHQKIPRVYHVEVANMIYWIHKNKPEGAILCFLPGWQDIKAVSDNLEKCLERGSAVILPLHSRLTLDEQARVFRRPPVGQRKIVLSTNVAETSITIDDIGYVVDTGCHKEERLSSNQSCAVLDDLWVSQANVNQRRGRAGRVRSGESYHLYTRDKYSTFPQFPTPELHRVPLQKVVLSIKTFDENEQALECLSEMPEPPSVAAISSAVDDLTKMGALTVGEKLTPLGRRISRFTTYPRLSKALIHATVFRCLNSMLTMTSVLSSDVDLFVSAMDERAEIAEVKRMRSPYSDHLATLSLFNEWKQLIENEEPDELFVIRNMLRTNSLRLISRLRQHSLEQLQDAAMIDTKDVLDLPTSQEWLLAVLLSGTQTYLFQRNWDYKNGRIKLNSPSTVTESGSKAMLLSDCACHKNSLPSSILVYHNIQESAVRRTSVVRDASCVPPVAVPLFIPSSQRQESEQGLNTGTVIDDSRKLSFRLTANSSEECNIIKETQKMLQDLVSYFVVVEGESKPASYSVVSVFRDQVVTVLSKLLQTTTHETRPS